jgi:hypothetical protein
MDGGGGGAVCEKCAIKPLCASVLGAVGTCELRRSSSRSRCSSSKDDGIDVTYLARVTTRQQKGSWGGVEGGYISSRSGDGRLSPDILPLEPRPTPLAADIWERRGDATGYNWGKVCLKWGAFHVCEGQGEQFTDVLRDETIAECVLPPPPPAAAGGGGRRRSDDVNVLACKKLLGRSVAGAGGFFSKDYSLTTVKVVWSE